MPEKIEAAAVLGAGVLGVQLAAQLAGAEVEVELFDVDRARVRAGIDAALKTSPPTFYDPAHAERITARAFGEAIDPARMIIDARDGHTLFIDQTPMHVAMPVRYERLASIISGPGAPRAVALAARIGKSAVVAESFLAERLASFDFATALALMLEEGLNIEDVDRISGRPIARPTSAVFRMADFLGLDAVSARAKRCGDALPAWIDQLVAEGRTGQYAGAGFYKKVAGEKRVLDPATLAYREEQRGRYVSLGRARDVEDPVERLRIMLEGDDAASRFARRLWEATWTFAEQLCAAPDDVDRAARLGLRWELGPFEARAALQRPPRAKAKAIELRALGDRAWCLELDTRDNIVGEATVAAIEEAIDRAEESDRALIIAARGEHFGTGADLPYFLEAARDKQWARIDAALARYQRLLQRLRGAKVKVLALPCGSTWGRSLELCLAAHGCVAHVEANMGFVEVGVGLIPAGGGCLFMVERGVELAEATMKIATVAVSIGAFEARRLGYLDARDRVVLDRDRLLEEALRFEPARPAPRPLRAAGKAAADELVERLCMMASAGMITDYDAVIASKLANVLAGGSVPEGTERSPQDYLDLEREAFLALCGEEKSQARIESIVLTHTPLRN